MYVKLHHFILTIDLKRYLKRVVWDIIINIDLRYHLQFRYVFLCDLL